jgi:hypothetical protein
MRRKHLGCYRGVGEKFRLPEVFLKKKNIHKCFNTKEPEK